jgi:hypothetical protein
LVIGDGLRKPLQGASRVSPRVNPPAQVAIALGCTDTGPFEVFRGVMNWHASGRPLVDPQCNWQRPGVGREINATCGAAYVFKESFGVVKCAENAFLKK